VDPADHVCVCVCVCATYTQERCLDFCVRSGKPWCLLMPNYVANKAYFNHVLQAKVCVCVCVDVCVCE
jgi:hypothetical protein